MAIAPKKDKKKPEPVVEKDRKDALDTLRQLLDSEDDVARALASIGLLLATRPTIH